MLEVFSDLARQLRAALAAGALWVLSIWLVGRRHLDPYYSKSLIASTLGRLADGVGETGSLILLLVLAGVLGAISQQVFRAPSLWIANACLHSVRLAEIVITFLIKSVSHSPILRRFEGWESIPVDLTRRILHDHKAEVDAIQASDAAKFQRVVYHEIDRLLLRELNDMAIAHSYVRDLEALVDLRLAIPVPLLFLVIIIAIQYGPAWLVGVIAPLVVAFSAVNYRRARDDELERTVWAKIDLVALSTGV